MKLILVFIAGVIFGVAMCLVYLIMNWKNFEKF